MLLGHTGHLGLWMSALAALFNGSWGVLTKLPRTSRTVSPLVMQYWVSEGMALSGLALLAVPPRVFTPWGLLSGALFVLSAGPAVAAISLLGLAAASGVWCGTAVLVSFAWGVLVTGDDVESMGQAVVALALILAGIAGVALASSWGGGGGHGREEGVGDSEALLLLGAEPASLAFDAPAWPQQLRPATRTLLGSGAALLTGAMGGLILAPMLAAPKEARGLQFVPSMAVGAMVLAPALIACLTCLARSITFTHATSSRAAGPGMAAGILWNAGNCCCILAVTDPHVGLAVAMPIMQCGLFVAGAWGIVLYREVRGPRPLALYWLGGTALVGDAALLAGAKGG